MGDVHVLIVDDDADTVEMLAELVRVLGHRVSAATSGLDAIDMFRAEPAQIVFLDLVLPGMSGFEVAKTIRALGRRVRLVALSGHTDLGYLDRIRTSGFDAYLRKPCTSTDLAAEIAASAQLSTESGRSARGS